MQEPLSPDQVLVSKITDIILVNLANENFGVKELAHESGLGYYKLNLRIHMDKAMKLAPDTYDYYNYLDTKGWGLYKQGRYLEALEILQRTCDSIPFPIYRIKSHLEEIKKVVPGQK
jgi:tetratricopeptide (TPR) repeat protein